MKQNIIITFILGIFFGAVLIYFLYDGKDEGEDFTNANSLPTGYFVDQNVCKYTCANTKCSSNNQTGSCPPGNTCVSGQCQANCGSGGPCTSDMYCDSSVGVCKPRFCGTSSIDSLTGLCDTGSTCVNGVCKLNCATGVGPNGYCASGTCDIDGQCRLPCGTGQNQSPTGYCNTGLTCINGSCTTTYSCANSCAATRVIG